MTQNNDWFVAATAVRGDGSREKPFHDPWLALRRAEPGDTIHVAAGNYFGRFDRSSWVIETPRITVLGGYSSDFQTRTPWKTPSVLGCFAGYEGVRENSLISGREDHAGLTLDGLCFDAAGRNEYSGERGRGISRIPAMDGAIASFSSADVSIRNCVFMNSANGGVELAGSGSRFENNLSIGMIGIAMLALRSSTRLIDVPIHVAGNTFCFMHDMGEPAGAGGDRSQGVRVSCPAVIENNVFVSVGNSAITVLIDPQRISIERNLFFATPHNLVTCKANGLEGEIREMNLEELEDLGFKACVGNVVKNPGIRGLGESWIDDWSRDVLARYARPPRDAIQEVRATAALPPLSPADVREKDACGATAPRVLLESVAISTDASQGFHAIELPAAATTRIPGPVPEYRRIDWSVTQAPDASLSSTRVELRVGLGQEQNFHLLADAPPETHIGVRIFDPGSDENSFFVLILRHAFATRQFREGRKYQRGAEVEKTYWMRGVLRTDVSNSRQKCTLIVESIEPAPIYSPPLPARPAGRDWFVRAAATGGDGSREKPFRDPFQALDKAEGGDTIHVAAGEYFGKLRSGQWLVTMRNLALLGGYDAGFTMRDPWTHHTRLSLDAGEKAKGRPSGTPLSSEAVSDGLVVDGFIFDGSTWNTYQDGSLDLAKSPLAPLIRLRGADAPVTVRNCVFVNASDGAVVLDCALAVFENNVVVNTSGDAVVINGSGAGPAIVRNNTILFATDPTARAGSGQSSSRGTLVQLKGRGAVALDSNVIGFADNYGVRATLSQDSVRLRNNVFGANLFNHLCDGQYLFADSENWARRVELDSDYALDGNAVRVPDAAIDSTFADAVLPRLYELPSRIAAREWGVIASALGAMVRPAEEASAPAPTSAPVVTDAVSGLAALMAKIDDTNKQIAASAATQEVAAKYCPAYDYVKAIALVKPGPDSTPGARRLKLEISFGAVKPKTEYSYLAVSAVELDALRESLNEKRIALDVTQIRDSSSNPSVFAPGTDKRDFNAYGVVAVESQTRTRLAIVVRADTDASRRMQRVQSTDKLQVRGIAYATSGASGLTILVESFETAGS